MRRAMRSKARCTFRYNGGASVRRVERCLMHGKSRPVSVFMQRMRIGLCVELGNYAKIVVAKSVITD